MSTFPRNVKLKQSPNHTGRLGVPGTGTPAEPLLTVAIRPTSDSNFRNIEFDAGLNSSAAWTEHLNVGHAYEGKEHEGDSLSISEEEGEVDAVSSGRNTIVGFKPSSRQASTGVGNGAENEVEADNQEDEPTCGPGRPARVLYDFMGEHVLKELFLRAGEEIEVLQEVIDDADGWSLARAPLQRSDDKTMKQEHGGGKGDVEEGEEGEVGLVPRAYYAFTTDFLSSPSTTAEPPTLPSHSKSTDEGPNGNGNATPRASTSATSADTTPKGPPLIPQNTGEWFRQQMRSVLGGRSLNRFSRFVTSGAEAYILRGAPLTSRPPPSTSSSDSAPLASTSNSSRTNESAGTDGLPATQDQTPRLSTYLSQSTTIHTHTREPTVQPPESSPDTHYIDVGDAGPTWRSKVPPFDVRVHSPEKRYTSAGSNAEEIGAKGGEAGAFIVYSVTSIFDPPSFGTGNDTDSDDSSSPSFNYTHAHTITVHRRFSHFVLLHSSLSSLLPGLALPPLPEKQYAGRLNTDFVEARRGGLQRYLRMLVRHPVVRYSEPVRFFLGCEDDVEWRRQLTTYLPHSRSRPSSSTIQAGRQFYSSVYHPPFQIDLSGSSTSSDSDSTDLSERFENHLQSVSQGVEHFRRMFSKIRQARVEMSSAERALGYELLGLITSRLSESGFDHVEEEEDEEEEEEEWEAEEGKEGRKVISPTGANGRSKGRYKKQRRKGLQNAEGAWCWREDCPDCLRLTKCMQKTAETLQSVGDLYDSHARRTMLETEDSVKDVAHPDIIYAPILDIHRETLERYKEKETEASSASINRKTVNGHNENPVSNLNNEEAKVASVEEEDTTSTRCETVLNTTLAEFDAYHTSKQEDFERIVKSHLDGEIAFYEKVLTRLQKARSLYDTSPIELSLTMPGPRQTSIYERHLHTSLNPSLSPSIPATNTEPLKIPAPHVLDNRGRSMRPVSDAICVVQGLLGAGAKVRERNMPEGAGDGGGREEEGTSGSVFGRLW